VVGEHAQRREVVEVVLDLGPVGRGEAIDAKSRSILSCAREIGWQPAARLATPG